MSITITTKRRRRGRPRAEAVTRPDYPYTFKLPDGRTVFVNLPGHLVVRDRSGEIGFLPEAVKILERIRALAIRIESAPSPGFIMTLREALGMTQQQMGQALGVDKLSVSRWERGQVKPSVAAVKGLRKLQDDAGRRGVVLP